MAKDITKWASPGYLKYISAWVKIRDCFDGEDAIKGKTTEYLPQLFNQQPGDYNNYLRRALFFPITGKTCTSMIGLAVTKAPKTTYPSILDRYFADDNSDYQFTEFYTSIFTEVVLMGRYGVLIDAPIEGATFPTFAPYSAENIVKWVVRDGKCMSLILREFREIEGDQFEVEIECSYRHCFINRDGVYQTQRLNEDLIPINGSLVTPTFTGSISQEIPFVCFGSSGVHFDVDKPPMQDICSLNLSHYLTSADLEWGRHIVGLPTPVVSGVDMNVKLHIGGTAAWILPPGEAKAYYLEFQGLGLKSLETAMSDKVSLMASVSARLVDSSTRGSEAAETVRLRYMSESASLVHIINSVESGCMMLYNMLAKLVKTDPVTIQFSREIIGVGVTFDNMATMFEAYLNGSVSKETLVYNLRRLDAIDPNRTDAQELEAIRNPPPAPTPAAP